MTIFGYHASHEQHSPRALLDYVVAAERAGFGAAMCSDHFHPWIPRQGHSGFTWSWLGAAMQATALSFGCVSAPGYRYHPAVLAQAGATLAEMYPHRFWIAVGSGEALNEHITGEPWPPKAERDARLAECVQVMRNLWDGVTVTHHGRVTVEKARLYTRPASAPPIFAAALTAKTARLAGAWADGLITVGMPPTELKDVIDAFREGGGTGKPIKIQAALAWATSDAEAARLAHEQWVGNVVATELLATLRTPEEFAAAAEFVTAEDLARKLPVGASAQLHLDRLLRYAEMGIDDVYLFNVTPQQREFIEFFGERVLPELRTSAAA